MNKIESRICEISPLITRVDHYKIVFCEVNGTRTLIVALPNLVIEPIISLLHSADASVENSIYDLLVRFINNSQYEVLELFVCGLENMKYKCKLTLTSVDHKIVLPCRIAEGVYIIMRCGGLVYIAEHLMSATCQEELDISKLEAILQKLVNLERYEEAADIRDKIKTLKSGGN